MSTFAQLIDRTYREYLRPVEEQEPASQLASTNDISSVAGSGATGILATDTTITYRDGFFTPCLLYTSDAADDP